MASENTIDKVLKSIVAENIAYLTETHHLLPSHHFRGRPERTTEDALTILTENIYATWKEGRIYSAVFMDVAGAFNNIHHNRLIHNMKKKRIPEQITKWVESFLNGRITKLKFNDSTSDPISTPAGTPQESPLSPILYIYYNSDLLDISQESDLGLGFIDDIEYGTKGSTATRNTDRLRYMLDKAEL